MIDPKLELADIAAEARVLLEREVRRGRRHVELDGELGPGREPGPMRATSGRSLGRTSSALKAPSGSRLGPGSHVDSGSRLGPTQVAEPSALSSETSALPALKQAVAECRKCALCETRTQTVFADGGATAKLVFVGEAPGRDEDLKGLPFVGRAGQLLDKMIAAIHLRRDDVYICNVLKCRPPENRTPLPEEVEECRPYLEQQLALVKPALICALGLSAVQALLKTKASMASMRGRTFEYKGIPLIPTYHPAALLRNPSLKRESWEDMQRVRDTLKARTGM